METKQKGLNLILVFFLVMICLSGPSWLVLRDHMDTENHENRELAPFPEISVQNYSGFSKGFEDYFNDHLQFRSQLVMLNSLTDYYVFRRSPPDQVVIGRDGWLFYGTKEDGDPIGNYMGENLCTEDELAYIASHVIEQRDDLAAKGIEFVIFVAPNRERVYSEYMPAAYGSPAEEYPAKQIIEYLKENTDIRVVYAYADLMEARKIVDDNLYYKTDTHWNWLGGYVGTRALMRELGHDIPALDDPGFSISSEGEPVSAMIDLMGLNGWIRVDDNNPQIRGVEENRVELKTFDYYRDTIESESDADDRRKLFMIKDSFAFYMQPYTAAQFAECTFVHKFYYSPELIDEYSPDIVVWEMVERYVRDNIGTFDVY